MSAILFLIAWYKVGFLLAIALLLFIALIKK